jgi:hypothetical protein
LPERIYKLQPDRTVHLRGFDSFAAAACIHSATPTGFSVSGTFRDPADFAVAVLYDADNFFDHPSIKYLPDFNFAGLTLAFDLNYTSGVQPIDSPKYNWIDWATLDCIREDGTTANVRLWDYAMLKGAFPAASATCNVLTDASAGIQAFDRLTLWYQNLAFDYTVPAGKPSLEFAFYSQGTGTVHSITVNGRIYSHTETLPTGESSDQQATALIDAINNAGDPEVIASTGSASNMVRLRVRTGVVGISIPVNASDGANAPVNDTMRYTTAAYAATQLGEQVNGTNWAAANTPHALIASTNDAALTLTAACYGVASVSGASVTWVSGTRFSGITPGSVFRLAGTEYTVASVESPTRLTLTSAATSGTGTAWVAPRGGYDGNLIELYSLASTSTLRLDLDRFGLSGGSSEVTWSCGVEFSALGIDRLRQCWLTFAPALVTGPYIPVEWTATFSNWQLSGDEATKALFVAGPGSVRIAQDDTACTYAGRWNEEAGFYSKYFANATNDQTASVTISYVCQFTHDLWVGTSLYSDRANAGVRLDGDAETTLVCRLDTSSAIVTRRQVRAGIAPGRHTVTLRPNSAGVFYFNYLEAAVSSDVPDALPPVTSLSPALDFDTDHTYKLSPARLMWIMDKLGYAGPMNEYLGVFWWNERKPVGGSVSTAELTFGGTFVDGDSVYLILNGTALGKAVFPADNPGTIANHFAATINGALVGVWASVAGAVLTLTARSVGPAYTISISASATSLAGTVAITRAPVAGEYGSWVIDNTATPPINRAARAWHADFYSECAHRGLDVATACSMELVNPPADFAAKFPDGTAVTTSTGFGTLSSQHCAIGNSGVLAYQKVVYRSIAGLQAAAGLTPCVQYGEMLWWYLAAPGGGMAYYDQETIAAAQSSLGRALHTFTAQGDDPAVNGGADAVFLRNRLRDHLAELIGDVRAAYPNAICELLWPYDVNYPSQFLDAAPPIGGRLNRFVNLPVEWQTWVPGGPDRIKVEALAFGTGMRNLNLVREAVALFPAFGWPLNRLRYLVPVFGSASPWVRELALALGAGIATNNLWAFDHVCLFNLKVPEGKLERRSFVKSA